MRMLKGLLAAVLALTVTACSAKEEAQPIKILAPQGAPALAALPLFGEENITVDTVSGTDALTAAFSKKDSEYDAIIAPINMGAALQEKGKTDYLLDSVVTWGNLYIVGSDDKALQTSEMFAAFGEQAVPQKVLLSSMDMKEIQGEIKYYAAANEVSAALLAGKAEAGMLAEPAVSATIAKAKQQGKELKVLVDLQQAYKEKQHTVSKGYPQAALFIKKGSEDKLAASVEKMETFANETSIKDPQSIVEAVEKAGTDKLGIPNAQIAQASWERQNIHVTKANTAKEDVAAFLKQFAVTIHEESYTK